MKKHMMILGLASILAMASGHVLAKDKTIEIASDNSGLAAEVVENLSHISTGLGVKAPLNISKEGNHIKIAGTNANVCKVVLTGGEVDFSSVKCGK